MMPQHWRAAERILVKLIARAFAVDNPELLSPVAAQSRTQQDSGPPAAAAAVAGAPPANAGGPEGWSMEHERSSRQEDA